MAAMAVLSTRSGQVARSVNSGCGWPISYCPVYKEFISGQAEPFLSRACRVATLSRPASRSGRFVKPRRGASRNFGAGSWPVASRNNVLGDGRSFRDSHGKPAPSLACAPLFWRWGLARRASRNNFRATAEASATASLALASVVFALGGWPDGLPETSFRAMKAEGSWNASDRDGRFINQNRTTADGRFHIVPCKELISGQAEPFLSRAGRIATLSRPASRSGRLSKPIAVYQGRPAYGSFINNGRFSRLRTRPVAAMAVLSIRSGGFHSAPHKQFINGQVKKAPYKASTIASYKAPRKASYTASKASYKASFHVGLPETIFRVTSKASATASLALASVVLALGGGRTGFPKQVSERCDSEGSWTASGRKGRFINQKRTNGQISKFGLRMADFILSRIRSSSAAKPSHLYQGLAELQLYQGRPAAVAVLSSLGGARRSRSLP